MPFKLRLKKSRQYNVVSKSLFVCGVELLDGGSLECTLGSESTGRDCLDNVCQRLGLNQPEFFGLQYIPRCTGPNSNPRWLEMERPVKRQLDKYASGPQLLLRVMFYITCPVSNLLTDETSRYHYFLQLKMDVIEGRIATTPQQAVLLASYSMQAEFGNYDAERHTPEYLKDFQLFPKHLTESESDVIEKLTEAATLQHAALRGLPSGTAEERYISACQKLEGYGQEKFIARDDQAQIVEIGISLNGITVFCEMNGEKKVYMWKDISNVINHKKYFTIECTNSIDTVQYQFNDVESAKHVWRMCVHQHTFHTRLQMMVPQQSTSPTGGANLSQTQNFSPNTNFECISSEPNLNDSHEKIQHSPQTDYFQFHHSPRAQQWTIEPSIPLLSQRAQSTSCLDLTTDVEKLRALLPSYRAAPDYETAIQQKYRTNAALHPNDPGHVLYSSQPEIRKPEIYTPRLHYPDVTHNNIEHTSAIVHHHPFSNSTVQARLNYDQQLKTAGSERQLQYYNMADLVEGMQMLHLYKPPPPYPSNRLSSNSTPDLAVASQRFNMPFHHFGAGIGHVSGSSPDLVSTKTLLNRHYLKQIHQMPYEHHIPQSYLQTSNAHGTYENLASLIDNKHYVYDAARQPAVIVENREITKHVQKIIDEHGNIIYCMPALMENQPYTSSTANYLLQQKQQSNTNEPIYENVPLPWQGNELIRERAESIQSAPETLPTIRNQNVNNFQLDSRFRTSLQTPQNNQEEMYVNLPPTIYSNDNSSHIRNYNSENLHLNNNAINDNVNIYPQNFVRESNGNLNSSLQNQSSSLKNSVSNSSSTSLKQSVHRTSSVQMRDETDSVPKIDLSSRTSETQSFIDSTVQQSAKLVVHSNVSSSQLSNKLNENKTNNEQTKNSAIDKKTTSEVFYNKPENYTKNEYTDSSAIDLSEIANVSFHQHISHTSMSTVDTSQSSSTTSKDKKRRRWGLLVGKSKSTDKPKSATLGREKNKCNLDIKEKHRWSTGLPRFQPLPPTINKETMCQILEHKLTDSQLFFEFEKIPKKKPNADFTTALLPENALRNRFKDVLPYEENRVRLTPTKENKFGYINASHITATVGNKQRFYIAAQGPTKQTLEDFWHAIWQGDVYLIVQLTDAQEDLNYIPSSDQRSITIGQYQIWSEFMQSNGNCSTSKLRLCNSQSRHYRSVWHMMYGLWGEQGCPSGGMGTPGGPQAHFLAFLEELRSVREHSVAQDIPPGHNRNPPTLVHCTAGVGRTGVAILCDLLLYTLDHNQELDVARTVSLLRHQRAHMVQTVAQYRFVYSLLIHYLKQTRLI